MSVDATLKKAEKTSENATVRISKIMRRKEKKGLLG
jgi:hypothetical protein